MSGINIKIAARAYLLRRGFTQQKTIDFASGVEWDFLLRNPLYLTKTDDEKTESYAAWLVDNGFFTQPIFGPNAPNIEIVQLVPRVSTYTVFAALAVMGALFYISRKR